VKVGTLSRPLNCQNKKPLSTFPLSALSHNSNKFATLVTLDFSKARGGQGNSNFPPKMFFKNLL
jgi:hypothetical protein